MESSNSLWKTIFYSSGNFSTKSTKKKSQTQSFEAINVKWNNTTRQCLLKRFPCNLIIIRYIQNKLVPSCDFTLKILPQFTFIIIHSCMLQFASRLLILCIHANWKANKFLNKKLLWHVFFANYVWLCVKRIKWFVCCAEYLFEQNFPSSKRDFFEDSRRISEDFSNRSRISRNEDRGMSDSSRKEIEKIKVPLRKTFLSQALP